MMRDLVVVILILSTASVIIAFAVLAFKIVEFRRLAKDHKSIAQTLERLESDRKAIMEILERIANWLGSR